MAEFKEVLRYPVEGALADEVGHHCEVLIYEIPGVGGHAFEISGEYENAGAFWAKGSQPFPTVEAAVAAANDINGDSAWEFDYSVLAD